MKNNAAKIFALLLVVCTATTIHAATTEMACPEKINASSASVTLEKPIDGFHAAITDRPLYLEAAGLYSGPPSLRAQLRGGKPAPGAIASWTLVPARSPDSPVPDKIFLETWISCQYAGGLIQLNRHLNVPGLSKCDLKKIKSPEGVSLNFICE